PLPWRNDYRRGIGPDRQNFVQRGRKQRWAQRVGYRAKGQLERDRIGSGRRAPGGNHGRGYSAVGVGRRRSRAPRRGFARRFVIEWSQLGGERVRDLGRSELGLRLGRISRTPGQCRGDVWT